jgi:hypothetical protein
MDRGCSSRLSIVEIEQSTASLATGNRANAIRVLENPINQGVVQPLMVPLAVIVIHVLRDRPSQVQLSQRHESLKTLGLCRKNKALREGVRIRAPRWQSHYLHAGRPYHLSERRCVRRSPVEDQIPLPSQEPSRNKRHFALASIQPQQNVKAKGQTVADTAQIDLYDGKLYVCMRDLNSAGREGIRNGDLRAGLHEYAFHHLKNPGNSAPAPAPSPAPAQAS